MSINRTSYLSLIESVNEAVVGAKPSTPAKVTKVAGKAVSKPTKTVKPSAASKLSTSTTTVANKSTGGGAGGGAGGGGGTQWGDKSIGGAMNAKELAAWLNSQSVPSVSTASAPKGSVADAQAASVKAAAKVPGMVAEEEDEDEELTDEDFDVIDEILAEGLEMYGEEGMTVILSHFAETGEIPQELADLLD